MTSTNAVGIDIGTARTKIAAAGSVHECASPPLPSGSPTGIAEHVSTRSAARRLARFLGEVFTGLVPVDPGGASVVFAVPDRWAVFDEHAVVAPEASQTGQAFARVLTTEVGFADARLVPGLQCVAAAQCRPGRPAGALLALDVGASAVDAAVYIVDGVTTRLVDAAHSDLTSAGWRDSPSEVAAAAVRRLLGRVDGPLLPHAVVTGGNAATAVLEAVTAAAAGRVTSVRWADPTETARGALLIARGEAVALSEYPHTVGVQAHRITGGELESLAIPLTTGRTRLTVIDDHTDTIPVVIKLNGTGPWLPTRIYGTGPIEPGTYEISLLPRQGTHGAVLVSGEDGESSHRIEL
ncbi:hypothetical protein JOD54_002197 [Actinokineospora baliensis]|uniref:hypothetical protein n=1 Tax=Actinokineospora baliensis TaxID=547056 RepID=UPI00195DD9C7|nr:hypothetical protein [Actinokineospora baliensis]MBM7771993.1 hypothetical protein [Actinokineospora baliensis]